MTIISPSLLACNFMQLELEIKELEEVQNIWLHLDIMDGHFVPNLTFGHEIIKGIAHTTKQKLDAHFMVTNPDFYIETLKDVSLHNFTFHCEVTHAPLELIKKAKKYFPSVGISLKPATPIEAIDEEVWNTVDLVLIMSVEPGFGGQKFMHHSLEKVKQLAHFREQKGLSFSIQMDGGINLETAPMALEAGADNLVAGSAVFKSPRDQWSKRIEELRSSGVS
jgi:ribulose-phosphate 3-epimerase